MKNLGLLGCWWVTLVRSSFVRVLLDEETQLGAHTVRVLTFLFKDLEVVPDDDDWVLGPGPLEDDNTPLDDTPLDDD